MSAAAKCTQCQTNFGNPKKGGVCNACSSSSANAPAVPSSVPSAPRATAAATMALMAGQSVSAAPLSFPPPARAIIMQSFLPEVVAVLKARSIPVVVLQANHAAPISQVRAELKALKLGPSDVVIAYPSWVDAALEELGIPMSEAPDYPACLRHLLRRNVWQSTLGQVATDMAAGKYPRVFIKPVSGAKSFNGLVVSGPADDELGMLLNTEFYPQLGPDVPVWCSEVIEMNSEYAVYVVQGRIAAACHYACKSPSCRCADAELAAAGRSPLSLDPAVVAETVRLLASSEDSETRLLTAGCRVDFALAKKTDDHDEWETAVVEVNDGYVAGRYDGLSADDYTDMILARFGALQGTGPAAAAIVTAVAAVEISATGSCDGDGYGAELTATRSAPTEIIAGKLWIGPSPLTSDGRPFEGSDTLPTILAAAAAAGSTGIYIVNCTPAFPFPTGEQLPGVSGTFRVGVEDVDEAPIETFFHTAAEFIATSIAAGGLVYVHCETGKSRSATIVLAYRMLRCGETLRTAFTDTKALRPFIMPKPVFFHKLADIDATSSYPSGEYDLLYLKDQFEPMYWTGLDDATVERVYAASGNDAQETFLRLTATVNAALG